MSRTAASAPAPAGRRGAARRRSGRRLSLGYPAPASCSCSRLSVLACLLDGRLGGQGLWAPAGLAYAGLSGLSLALLRDGDQAGLVAILFLFAVVWATDISAYFVGRALGGPKLAPSISPGKTQSGAIGGAVGGVRRRRRCWPPAAGVGNLPLLAVVALAAFGRLPGRRPLRILGQAASRRQGFRPPHSRPWRRHGPGRRACRGGLCPIRHRLDVRQRRQAGAGSVCDLMRQMPGSRICAGHGFAGIDATARGADRAAAATAFEGMI